MNSKTKKTRSILALMMIIVLVLTMGIPLVTYAGSVTLSDIKGFWAEKEINAWVEQGFIDGYPDGTFKPDNQITRAEFIALVNRVFKFTGTAPVTFKDVSKKNWFYNDVAKAEKAGYLSDLKDGSFVLKGKMVRQEVAAIICRLMKLTPSEADANGYSDAKDIPAAFKGFIGAVTKAGYMEGSNGKFSPKDMLTRAQAVKALDNLIRISFGKLADQKAYVGSSTNVFVPVKPTDAALTVKSSDEAIVTAAVNGSYINLKGIKTGSATITVTGKKAGYFDGESSFKVTVETAPASSSSSGSSGGTTPPPPPPPVIPVAKGSVEIAEIGTSLVARVILTSAERGTSYRLAGTANAVAIGQRVQFDATGKTSVTFELLNASGFIVGRFTVQLKAANFTANITEVTVPGNAVSGIIGLALVGNTTVVRLTVAAATAGVSFRLEGTQETTAIGQRLQFDTIGKNKADIELLDAHGAVVGKFSVDLTAGSFQVSFTKVTPPPAPKENAQGNIQLAVVGATQVARITVASATVGTAFRLAGTQEAVAIGQKLQYDATGKTSANIELLDNSGTVVGTFTVNLAAGNFVAEVDLPAPVAKKVTGTVQLATVGATVVARVTVTSATVGTAFRQSGTQDAIAVGQRSQIDATGLTTVTYELLNAQGAVIGSFVVPMTNGSFTLDVN